MVLLVLFICPFLLREETLCLISTPLVAIEFWASRNFGRKFLQAEWHVDTSTEEDIWVYEAQLSAPAGFEAVFWYSFVLYGAALVASMLMSLKDGRLSLLCVQITAFVANYIHFFAYSTIIRLRNEGVFQQIAKEALGQESVINVKESVRLPLVYRSNRDNLNIIVVDAR